MIEDLKFILTHSMKSSMIEWMNEHPEAFDSLINLAVSDHEPYAWRASWLLWDCMQENDSRIKDYVPEFIRLLKKVPENRKREYLKILLMMEIDAELEGILFDEAVKIWSKISSPPALRLNAFRLLLKMVKKHPELKAEFDFLIQDHYLEDLSKGVLHSIKKMIKKH